MSAVRIAIYQAQSGIDPTANAERLAAAVQEAASGGAAMLFTPEMSGMLDRDRERAEQKLRAAEKIIHAAGLATIRESVNAVEAWLGSLPGHRQTRAGRHRHPAGRRTGRPGYRAAKPP